MLTEKSCTDVAQQWHVPRKNAATSSPKKAQNMHYRVHKMEDDAVQLSPRTVRQETSMQPDAIPGEEDRLVNLIKNYQVRMLWI